MIRAPVIFLIFNRPVATARSLERIAAVRPASLFVVADGPRASREGEEELCRAARAVIEQVDWDCEVTKDYSDVNLGEVTRVPAAITTVLAQTKEAIIIEDDCLALPSFFRFCDDLLERYRSDPRVMSITGFNPLGTRATPYSYTYARNPVANGAWATWQRAWQHYDYDLSAWPALRTSRWLEDIVPEADAATLWRAILDGAVSPSDYGLRWVFNCWTQNALGIVPTRNLVTNIGFGDDATHMRGVGEKFFDVPAEDIRFPLRHPAVIARDRELDERVWEFMYSISPLARRKRTRPLRRVVPRVLPSRVRHQMSRIRAGRSGSSA
jgi:hypothetical protein